MAKIVITQEMIDKHVGFIKGSPLVIDDEFRKGVTTALQSIKCINCQKDCEDRYVVPQLIPKTPQAVELSSEISSHVDVGIDLETGTNMLIEYMIANNIAKPFNVPIVDKIHMQIFM